jgi:hypothetical protein
MWARVFTDAMLEQKRAGASFDRAWERAVAEHGVRVREIGGGTGTLSERATLEDDARVSQRAGAAERWWRGVCRAAWENAPAPGGGPSRLYLLPGLTEFVSAPDESAPARSPRRAGTMAPMRGAA